MSDPPQVLTPEEQPAGMETGEESGNPGRGAAVLSWGQEHGDSIGSPRLFLSASGGPGVDLVEGTGDYTEVQLYSGAGPVGGLVGGTEDGPGLLPSAAPGPVCGQEGENGDGPGLLPSAVPGTVGGLEGEAMDGPRLLFSAAAVPVCALEGGTEGGLEMLLSETADPADCLEGGTGGGQGLLISAAAGPAGDWEGRPGGQVQPLPLPPIFTNQLDGMEPKPDLVASYFQEDGSYTVLRGEGNIEVSTTKHVEKSRTEQGLSFKRAPVTKGEKAMQNFILERSKDFLDVASLSPFITYKNPVTIFHHLSNIKSTVERFASQRGVLQDEFKNRVIDPVKQWKMEDYPLEDIENTLVQALPLLKKRVAKTSVVQKNLFHFFQRSPKMAPSVKVVKPKPSNTVKEPVQDYTGDSDSFEEVANLLEVDIKLSAIEMKEKTLVQDTFKKLLKELRVFKKRSAQVKLKSKWFQKNSKVSESLEDTEKKLSLLSEGLKEAEQVRLKLEEDSAGKPLIEKIKVLEEASNILSDKEKNLITDAEKLTKEMKVTNFVMRKKINRMNYSDDHSEDVEIKLESNHGGDTWEDCFAGIGNKEKAFGVTLNQEQFMKIKSFCDSTYEDGHEFFTVGNLLKYLRLSSSAASGVSKLVLKFLPIMMMKKGEHKIFVDNRVFFRNPENIFHLFDMISKKDVEEEEVVHERTKSKPNPEPRKPGSGRKRKLTEEDIKELKQFMECIGTQAHPRRRDEAAGYGGRFGGGTWKGDMYRFAEGLFQKKQEQPPSQSTVRRCGLPPNKHNSAAVRYHGNIEAKPMSVQNNLTLGSIHPAAHHCSTNVKIGLEMAHSFPADSRCTSNDDKVGFGHYHDINIDYKNFGDYTCPSTLHVNISGKACGGSMFYGEQAGQAKEELHDKCCASSP